ncbi:MAG: hypothetical protein ACRDTF_11845, partial [Pseudonocardiaceae bacterium]
MNQRGRRRGLHLHTDASRVRHWLQGQHPQPPVPELLSDDRQALGQRYLIQALRLAQESGDAALGANVLADMSDQALMLG